MWFYHCSAAAKTFAHILVFPVSLYWFNSLFCIVCRAAPSARSPCLHRACVHSATSGCAISAPTCTSTRDRRARRARLSTQTCTHSRGPLPSSVLTCTREAPVPFLQTDKARNSPLSLLPERRFFLYFSRSAPFVCQSFLRAHHCNE